MRILIFGGTGQIGARLTLALCERGDEVVIVGRHAPKEPLREHLGGRLRWSRGDVRDAAQVLKICNDTRPDRIVHLAALLQFACATDPDTAIDVNVRGTLNVLDAARDAGVERVIFGSSIAVYGQRCERLVEEGPVGPGVSFYGATKLLGEQLGERFAENWGLGFVALRYCGVFGGAAPTSAGMARVRHRIQSVARGGSVVIEDASGEERAQLTYVADAAAATLAVIDHANPGYRVYNVAAPEGNYISLHEFYQALKSVAPAAGTVRFTGAGAGMAPVSVDRLQDDLGFVARHSVSDGLRAALNLSACAGAQARGRDSVRQPPAD